jgi:hypothetical protein
MPARLATPEQVNFTLPTWPKLGRSDRPYPIYNFIQPAAEQACNPWRWTILPVHATTRWQPHPVTWPTPLKMKGPSPYPIYHTESASSLCHTGVWCWNACLTMYKFVFFDTYNNTPLNMPARLATPDSAQSCTGCAGYGIHQRYGIPGGHGCPTVRHQSVLGGEVSMKIPSSSARLGWVG